MEQLDLFASLYEKPKLPSHIRMIEIFAGIGATAKAMEILGADFELWRTCEWSWQSITAYNAIHMGGRIADTSNLSYKEVLERIKGVSHDYNKPMTEKQLIGRKEPWARELLGRMIANHNYCPDVSKLHAKDLMIIERERDLPFLVLVPMPRLVEGWTSSRNGERKRHEKRFALADRENLERVQRTGLLAPSASYGECSRCMRNEKPTAVE